MTAATTAALTLEGSFTAQAYCAILCGAMLAQLLEWPRTYAVIAAATRVPSAVPLAFIVALFVMLRYIEFLPAVALVATYLVAHVTLQDSVMRRLLGWGPLVYLGQRSYGAYLLHVLAIHIGYMLFRQQHGQQRRAHRLLYARGHDPGCRDLLSSCRAPRDGVGAPFLGA